MSSDGNQTDYVYNEHGLPVFKTEAFMTPLARTTEWRYEGPFPSQVTEMLVPSTSGTGERVTSFDYDPTTGDLLQQTIGGVEETFNPPTFSLTTSYSGYNAAGRPGEIDPPGYDTPPTDVTTFTYDPARGDLLPLTRTDPLIGSTTYDYDAFNRRTMVTDPNGVATETQYDAMDRVTRVIVHGASPAGDLTTVYAYNRYGDLDTVTLPRLNVIQYGYDGAGRLISIERKPNASTAGERTVYTLDGAGNRTHEELQRWSGSAWVPESATQYDYSTRCHLDRIIRAPGLPEESITDYDYDCNDNLSSVWDSTRDPATDPPSQSYAYDALGRMTEVRQPWGGSGGGVAVTSYGYDVQDHLASVLDAEGNETTYTTGDRDLLTDEVSPVSGTTTHAYNEHGELITTTDARGVVTQRVDRPARPGDRGHLRLRPRRRYQPGDLLHLRRPRQSPSPSAG